MIERQENDVVAQDLPERALASSRVKDGGSANHVLSGKVNNADVFKSRLVSPLIETRPQGGGGFVPQEMRMRFSSQLDEKFATARARAASDKNQLMDALLNQPEIPADYGETMVSLCRDKSQDLLTRDFAVQHIGLYVQTLNRRGEYNAKSAEAMSLRDALFDAAGETRTVVAAGVMRASASNESVTVVMPFAPFVSGTPAYFLAGPFMGDGGAFSDMLHVAPADGSTPTNAVYSTAAGGWLDPATGEVTPMTAGAGDALVLDPGADSTTLF